MGKGRILATCVCAALGVSASTAAVADSFTVQTALDDTRLYFTAPLRWDREDWLYFAGTLAVVGAAHSLDTRVRTHFATGSNAILNGADKNSVRDALPAVALIAGTWAYAGFIRDSDGYRETWSLLEAGVFSTVTGEVLTYAAGRERPDATTSANRWRDGGDSFPSVHASAAFAIGMVFAESGNDEYRWLRRLVGYGVAGAALTPEFLRAATSQIKHIVVCMMENRSFDHMLGWLTNANGRQAGLWQLSYSIRTR